ncbi:MAG: hypothetical protein QOE63_348 [Acidimicrobiaceae bacterium]
MLRRLGLVVLVLAAVATPTTARAATAPPSCAPGGPALTYVGDFAPADAKTYHELPFEVGAGTTRVEITYDWADKPLLPGVPPLPSTPLTSTVLDLGLWDQHGYRDHNGFRGWSGSREGRAATGQDPVFVQQDIAQRGYRPDPIVPGTWSAELGVGAIAPTGASWTVTITCTDPVTGEPFVSQPVDPTHVANPNPGWYHGDFHMHSYHSNAHAPTYQEEVDYAKSVGLDFLPLTDYVTNQHWRELGPIQAANPDVVVWPGREIITYYGHMIEVGETPDVIDYRQGFEDVSLRDVQAQTKADGALFQVAHPAFFPSPIDTLCRGCHFDLGNVIDWSLVDSMEVQTGPVLVDSSQVGLPALPLQIQNPFTQGAIDLWVNRLMAGYKITAVSGSDSKGVEGDPNDLWGTNDTAVYADQLSRAALQCAVKAGHAYVQTRGVPRSPTLEMTAVTPAGEQGMFGDVLHSDTAQITVHVTGASGQLLTIFRNADIAALPVLVDSNDFTYSFAASRSSEEGPLGTFYRVQTADLQSITTIGNPIFLTSVRVVQPTTQCAAGAVDPVREGANGTTRTLPATGRDAPVAPLGALLVLALVVRWKSSQPRR